MDCIFIGDKFYDESGTMMSSIYQIDTDGEGYHRTDWGQINICLKNGGSVNIRPATPNETEIFEIQLLKIKQIKKQSKNQYQEKNLNMGIQQYDSKTKLGRIFYERCQTRSAKLDL